ncbi:hypothetical protein F5B20DRAFT_564040 [Whalleya microplaca]|nr:hypothetical protein F5B20DRAFT_564040 [Whalleya microplaca]
MTLRKALTQGKPSFPCKVQSYGNSKNSDWPKIQTNNIVSWDAFNIQNLNASYGHILDSPIPEGQLDVPKPSTVLSSVQEIAKAHDINHLIQWSDGVLGPTFEFARKKLELQLGTAVKRDFMKPETHLRPGLTNKSKNGRIKADHAIQLDDLDMPMLVLGLGRTSRHFPGRRIINQDRAGPLWLVRQLANLCVHSNTRYGYILTEEDFVACCFSTEDRSGWTVAVKAVPWTKAGETQLTTDLALWWLCMLAISSRSNRRLTCKKDTIGIDHWDVRWYGDDRGWVRRHHYSLVEEPTVPPTPPPYRSPSPANAEGVAAAFSAGVGINADPDFDLHAETVLEPNANASFDFVAGPIPAHLQQANDNWDDLPDLQQANDNWNDLPDFNVLPGQNQF